MPVLEKLPPVSIKTQHREVQWEKVYYSANPDLNAYAAPGPSSDGEYELLDYILISKDEGHKEAEADQSTVWVEPLKSRVDYAYKGALHNDLSDHFPVWGRFAFHFDETECH